MLSVTKIALYVTNIKSVRLFRVAFFCFFARLWYLCNKLRRYAARRLQRGDYFFVE